MLRLDLSDKSMKSENLRFMNDWGNKFGLWDRAGAWYPDSDFRLSKGIITRLEKQSEFFHQNFSADTGKWSSDALRLQHREEILDLAVELSLQLHENVELTHVPWEHGIKGYIVKTPL